MKLPFYILLFCVTSPAFAFDYTNYGSVCTALAKEEGVLISSSNLDTCICGYTVIERDLGKDVAVITAKWAYEDVTLIELTKDYSVAEYYNLLESVAAKIDRICSSSYQKVLK